MTSFKKFFLERLYHGTPNDIEDDFSLNFVGSGEGSQVFGWGLYFAENQKVASTYRKSNSNRMDLTYKGKTIEDWINSSSHSLAYVWEKIGRNVSKEELLDYPLDREQKEFVLSLPDDLFFKGNLYEVNITASHDSFIPYDEERLDDSHTIIKKINSGIKKIFNTDINLLEGSYKGNEIYNEVCRIISRLENNTPHERYHPTIKQQKAGTMFLSKIGIKGIKYLDEYSRGAEEGKTYNYVIFDPSVVQIVSKNGDYVMTSKKPESHLV
jgi:hypothetical protein